MNKLDDLKQLRLQEELKYVDADLVEDFAKIVLDGVASWSNNVIFSKQGGELSIEFPLGPPNAGVLLKSLEPLKPTVIIRQSMLTDIYRDALTYPLLCRKIADETGSVRALHEHPLWKGQPFVFSTGVPELQSGHVLPPLSLFCEAIAKRHEDEAESKMATNDVRCRFVMLELMLVWTFFHELGHVLQQHYRFRSGANGLDTVEAFLEFDEVPAGTEHANNETTGSSPADLAAQARELMADAEAMDLTLKYLLKTGRLKFPMVYLLLCSVGCMFQRFYKSYSEDLNVTSHRHPHPALRQHVSEAFLSNSICDFLVANKLASDRTSAAVVITYMSVRADLFTGLFRANRIEQRDDESTMPSYMRLQSETFRSGMHSYQDTLMPYIESQLAEVRQWHLLPGNRLDDWFEMLRANQCGPAS